MPLNLIRIDNLLLNHSAIESLKLDDDDHRANKLLIRMASGEVHLIRGDAADHAWANLARNRVDLAAPPIDAPISIPSLEA